MMQQFWARNFRRPRAIVLVGGALCGLVAAAACSSVGGYAATARPAAPAVAARPAAPPAAVVGAQVASAAADGPTIRIKNYQFETPSLTVPAGTTVSWLNDDVDVHTATSRNRAFSSPGLDRSETYAFRFDTPGTYAYFCALHPQMTAEIVVQ
jgi:plastocyanin